MQQLTFVDLMTFTLHPVGTSMFLKIGGTFICFNFVLLNASFPINVNVDGNLTLVNSKQP